MGTEIKNTVIAADVEAQYDEKAKKLLSNKHILAHILVTTVDEFKGMNPKDVIPLIEGEPKVSVVPVDPGMTNAVEEVNGEKIIGLNTENAEINEGLIRFDIIFYVRMKDGITQIIVNVEGQKSEPTEYHILNRAIFYVCRMISSQKGRDFVNSKFNDIKRCHTIWVCMNMDDNIMNHIHLADDALLGSHKWEGKLDLINIVLVGLAKEIPEHDEKYELHRLLGALLSQKMPAEDKLRIMESEYGIPVEDEMKEDLRIMCNLSQGIKEEERKETTIKFIMNMYKKNLPLEGIAEIAEISVDEVKAIIQEKELVTV